MPAGELGKLPNKVSIEGHTDSKPYAGIRDYGNWELSTDRANAARRLMQQKGVGLDQVSQVRGFADQKLRKADNPLDSSNRRITLIVQYIVKDLDEDSTKPGDFPEGAKPAEDKSSPSHPPDH
jgi:chemotaxis protein MotB